LGKIKKQNSYFIYFPCPFAASIGLAVKGIPGVVLGVSLFLDIYFINKG
jgi:hypothetical protein